MTGIAPELRAAISARAAGRCEYCLRPQVAAFFQHEIDHIVAIKHGGQTIESNLCLCCAHCKRHKGSDMASIDPLTGDAVFIYNPRHDIWSEHFRLNGGRLEGLTPKGRATVRLLDMNSADQVNLRLGLIAVGRYP